MVAFFAFWQTLFDHFPEFPSSRNKPEKAMEQVREQDQALHPASNRDPASN
jgi:hypothetical protein